MTSAGLFELLPIDGSAAAAAIGPDGLGLAQAADGTCRIGGAAGAASAPATIRVDRRGLVLEVRSLAPVHVNGRPVRERALIRAGDVIVVGRSAFRVRTVATPNLPEQTPAPVGRMPGEARLALPRGWLRCVVGRHAGQVRALADGVTLPWTSAPGACGARLSIEDGRILAHATGALGLCIDGHPVRCAVLAGGEQLVVGGEHYVVDGVAPESSGAPESPTTDTAPEEAGSPAGVEGAESADTGGGFSPWWLLAAAVVIAVALGLLFGRG